MIRKIILTLLLLLIYSSANAQSNTSFRFRKGLSLPLSCASGDVFFQTSDATFYGCTVGSPTNTWSSLSGGGGGTPGGSNTQVQYNNAGAFGGITGATTDGTKLTLVAPILGTPTSGNLVNETGYLFANLASKPTTLSGYGITDGASNTRLINTTSPITGGGDLSADRTIAFDFTVGNTFTNLQQINPTSTDTTGLAIKVTSSTTNVPVDALQLNWQPTGTAGAGGGAGIIFLGKSTTTVNRSMADIEAIWTDPANTTRTADLVFQTALNGTVAERARITSGGVLNAALGLQINSGNIITSTGPGGALTANAYSSTTYATDSLVVHLAGSETITGAKTFGSGLLLATHPIFATDISTPAIVTASGALTITPASNAAVLFSTTERIQIGGTSNHFQALRASTDSALGYPMAIEYADDSALGVLKIDQIYQQSGSFNTAAATIRMASNTIQMSSVGIIGFTSASTITTTSPTVQSAFSQVSSGVIGVGLGPQGSTAGSLLMYRKVTAKTGDYTVVAADSNTFFTNTGAGAGVNFTLPTAVVGQMYEFYRDTNQTITITAGASTTIRIGSSVTAAAGNVTLDAVGSKIRLTAISTTQWVGDITGTATFN